MPIVAILIVLFSIPTLSQADHPLSDPNDWNSFKSGLVRLVSEAQVLDAFWYGDDGVDCGKPSFVVTGIDFANKVVNIEVTQAYTSAYGCAKTPFVCGVPYVYKNRNEIELQPVELLQNCQL